MRGLFRLAQAEDSDNVGMADLRQRPSLLHKPCAHALVVPVPPVQRLDRHFPPQPLVKAQQNAAHRSEEHTSELQSHLNLVCRLLLEKKKCLATAADIYTQAT